MKQHFLLVLIAIAVILLSALNAQNIQFYSQNDPAWASLRLGSTSQTVAGCTIGIKGCAVTDVAMLLQSECTDASYVSPSTLNTWLINNNGYSYSGGYASINWITAANMDGASTGLQWVATSDCNDAWSILDNNLALGNKIVVKVDFTPSTTQIEEHWVIVYGKNGPSGVPSSYQIMDPWPQAYTERTLAYYYDPIYDNTFFRYTIYSGNFSSNSGGNISVVSGYPLTAFGTRTDGSKYFLPAESSSYTDNEMNLRIQYKITNSGTSNITLSNYGIEVKQFSSTGPHCFYLNADQSITLAPAQQLLFNRLAYLNDNFMVSNSSTQFYCTIRYSIGSTWYTMTGSGETTFTVMPRPPISNSVRFVKSCNNPTIWFQQDNLRFACNSATEAALLSTTWETDFILYPSAVVNGLYQDHPQSNSVFATIVGRNLVWKSTSSISCYQIAPDPSYNNQLRSRWIYSEQAFDDLGYQYSLMNNTVVFSQSAVTTIQSLYPLGSTIYPATLNPPTGLTATLVNGIVNLSWNAPSPLSGTLSGYRIYRNNSQIGSLVTVTNYSDMNVISGSTYVYYIKAVYVSGESENSNSVSVTIPANSFLPPTSLTCSSYPSRIVLSWLQPSGQSSGSLSTYRVYRNESLLTSTTSLFYQDLACIPGTTYFYHVTAVYVNPSGESEPSNTVSGTPGYTLTPPNNLTGVVNNQNVVLTWDSPTSYGLTGFKLYRNSTSLIVISNPAIATYTDTDLPAGVYVYDISAIYPTGESTLANSVTVTVTGGGYGSNLLINAGFEQGTNGWSFNHALNGIVTVVQDGDCVEGNSKAVFSIPAAGTQEWLEEAYQLVFLDPDKIYNLSFWCKNSGPANSTISLIVMNNSDPWQSYGFWQQVIVSPNWVKHQYIITTNTYDSNARLNWQIGTSSSFELDACSLQEIQPVDITPGNLLLNPDFELESYYPWHINDSWLNDTTPAPSLYYVDESTSFSGTRSMYFQASVPKLTYQAQILQPINLVSGAMYQLTFAAKAVSARNISVETHLSESPFSNTGCWQNVILSSNWNTFSYMFQSNQTGASNLVFHLGGTGSTIGVWLDNISLTQIAGTALPGIGLKLKIFPNPSHGNVHVLPGGGGKSSNNVKLLVYNIKGQLVRDLSGRVKSEGDIEWDRTDLNGNIVTAGMYFIRLTEKEGASVVKKIILIE